MQACRPTRQRPSSATLSDVFPAVTGGPRFGCRLKEGLCAERAATHQDCARSRMRFDFFAEQGRTQRHHRLRQRASASRPHTTAAPVGSSSSSASYGLQMHEMGPQLWVDVDTPSGCKDGVGSYVGDGGGSGDDCLTTSTNASSLTLRGTEGPSPLQRLLPPTFEVPVSPPPAPTIDWELEMDGVNDWPGMHWSAYHPEGELLVDLLSSPPASVTNVGRADHPLMTELPSLPPLTASPMKQWTGTAAGAMMTPPPPQPQPAAAAALETAAKPIKPSLVLRLPGGTAASAPPGSIDVPRFVVTEDASSSDLRAPTSPTAVSWGLFDDDSDASSSEPLRGAGPDKMNASAGLSRRVLAPSTSMSKVAVTAQAGHVVTALSIVAASLPAPMKRELIAKRSKKAPECASPCKETSHDAVTLATGTPHPSTGTAVAAVPPARKRKQATFTSPVPSRFCHLCSRTAPAVRHVVCGALASSATCRKVVCDRCFSVAGPTWLGGHTFDTAVAAGNSWRCSHCVGNCPARAQCRNYTRTNERLRLARSASVGDLTARSRSGGAGEGQPPTAIHRRVGTKLPAAGRADSKTPKAKRSRPRRLAAAVSYNVLMPQQPAKHATTAATPPSDGTCLGGPAAMVAVEEIGRVVLTQAQERSAGGAGLARTNLPCPSVSRRLF